MCLPQREGGGGGGGGGRTQEVTGCRSFVRGKEWLQAHTGALLDQAAIIASTD